MDYKARIKPFILNNFLFTDDAAAVADDASLIRGGIVDSTGILELVGFLEESFGLKVADADIVPANLDTIDRIAAFIERKKAA